jgi:hypothetical protein
VIFGGRISVLRETRCDPFFFFVANHAKPICKYSLILAILSRIFESFSSTCCFPLDICAAADSFDPLSDGRGSAETGNFWGVSHQFQGLQGNELIGRNTPPCSDPSTFRFWRIAGSTANQTESTIQGLNQHALTIKKETMNLEILTRTLEISRGSPTLAELGTRYLQGPCSFSLHVTGISPTISLLELAPNTTAALRLSRQIARRVLPFGNRAKLPQGRTPD